MKLNGYMFSVVPYIELTGATYILWIHLYSLNTNFRGFRFGYPMGSIVGSIWLHISEYDQ